MKTWMMGMLALSILLVGCASTDSSVYTKQGSVYGGLLGSAAGGIVGHQSGRGLEGAAIGAGLGMLYGGLMGNSRDEQMDRQFRQNNVQHYTPTTPPVSYYHHSPSYRSYPEERQIIQRYPTTQHYILVPYEGY